VPELSASENPALSTPLSLFDVSGRVAIITGASGALGRAVAVSLGALGCKLLLASGSPGPLEQVAAEVAEVGGTAATVVRRPDTLEDAEAIVQAAVEAFGRVDTLVVASGLNKPAMIQDMAVTDWEDVMDANVRGAWLMAKAFGTRLIGLGEKGKVVLISSVRGRHGNAAGYSSYSTSKGATDALTKVLATEWGKHGINVNAIAPAVFRSALTAWIFEDTEAGADSRARNMSRIPLGRIGEPEDFVGIALYLVSAASDFCTGQIIYVDGGYTAA
jgi:NAD(P)-dependent dehydrogenase (short-subunit alcohol dehydrogenase family)